MNPNHTITCNINNYEDMSVEEINALINRLSNLRSGKLIKRANEYAERLSNLICDIMDNGFEVYFGETPIEPSDLDVRIDWPKIRLD